MFCLLRKIPLLVILFWAYLCSIPARGLAPVEKPNILFFLMDDLGWRDTGFAGSGFYETPNIDKLAKRGVILTKAYSAAPICSPTRASLITGLYPARIGLTLPRGGDPEAILKSTVQEKPCTWIEAKQNPHKVSGLEPGPANQRTLQALSATRLSTEYPTVAKIFKANGYRTAHFGKWHVGPAPYSPIEHGFDVDEPHVNSAGPLRPGHFGPWPEWEGEGAPASKGRQIDDVLAEHAIRFIEENKGRPFYVNFWTYGVHLPFQAKPEVIEYFKAKAKPEYLQRNPLYAAMIKHTDDAIGKVWQAVEACGLAEKTIVVFLSDNGGVDNKMSGARKEFEGIPVTSNAPLRGGKGDIYEGGVRIPGFFIWPGKTRPASECAVPFNSVDLLPTLAEICGFQDLPKLDGHSFVKALQAEPMAEAPVFIHYPHYGNFTKGGAPATSVVIGGWKLIQFYFDGPGQKHRYELYDLSNDPGEKRNLSRSHPEKVESLREKIAAFVQTTQAVLPVPNPEYRDVVKSELEGIQFQLFQPELLPNRKYPLILCLPDEKGGLDNVAFAEFQRTEMQFGKPTFLLAPQNFTSSTGLQEKMREGAFNLEEVVEGPQIGKLVSLLQKVLQEYPIDPRRVYITGGAAGGTGTWEMVLRHPELFAAAIPINGASSPRDAVRLRNLPVWIFHGKGDSRVPAASAQTMRQAMENGGSTVAKYTACSGTALETVEEVWRTPEVIQWLLEQKQAQPPRSSAAKPFIP